MTDKTLSINKSINQSWSPQ